MTLSCPRPLSLSITKPATLSLEATMSWCSITFSFPQFHHHHTKSQNLNFFTLRSIMANTFQSKYSIDCLKISPDQKHLLCTQSKLNGATWGGRIDVLDMSQSAKRVSASETSSVRSFSSLVLHIFLYINYTTTGSHISGLDG